MIRTKLLAVAGAGALAVALAACGGSSDSSGGTTSASGVGSPWILGTTDTVTALDPAGSYDLGSSTLEYNLYQTLVTVPPNSTQIVGDAAKSCTYDDPTTLTCTLNPGEKFSNGDALTSADVKYSFERAIKIQDANGAAIYLLGSITDTAKDGTVTLNKGAIETPDDTTVVFHLDHPDTTFQYVLTYPGAAAIVDEDVFPADKKLADDQIIGSGPYKLSQYKAGDQAVLELNSNYTGPNPGKTLAGLRQVLHGAVRPEARRRERRGRRGLAQPGADRHHRPQERQRTSPWPPARARRSATGSGTSTVGVGKQLAIRQAAAQIIDRDAIAKDAYDGTVDPLYSIVPPGYGGANQAFKTQYGAPDTAKAAKILKDAGISTPVNLTVGWTPTHYGPSTEDEANEFQRQLEASGLFKVDPEEHRVGAVPDHLQAGCLRPVDPRLVPGLPGR